MEKQPCLSGHNKFPESMDLANHHTCHVGKFSGKKFDICTQLVLQAPYLGWLGVLCASLRNTEYLIKDAKKK